MAFHSFIDIDGLMDEEEQALARKESRRSLEYIPLCTEHELIWQKWIEDNGLEEWANQADSVYAWEYGEDPTDEDLRIIEAEEAGLGYTDEFMPDDIESLIDLLDE